MASRTLRVVIAGDASGATKAFKETGDSADSFIGKLQGLGKAWGEASTGGQKLKVLGDQLGDIGKQMTTNVTLPIVGVGAAAAKLAMDFESSFAQIEALVGITGDTLDGLKKSTLDLAGETGKAPKELAEGLYFLTSAGLDAAKAQDALVVSAKASAAGLGTTAQVADALSSAMNAWEKSQLTAAQAGDILAATATYGKIEADQLAGSIGQVTAIASNAGVRFDEVGAAIATLSLNGGSASEQVTKLRAIISAIIKPSQQAANQLENVGLTVEGVQQSLRNDGLLATIRLLGDAFAGNQQGLAEWSGTMEALNGILGITGLEASKVDGIFQGVANSAGSVDKAVKVVEQTSAFKLKQAFAELQATGIEIGNALLPALTDLAGIVAKVATAFAGLPAPVQTGILVFAGLAAAIGPVLSVAGTLSGNIAALGPILASGSTALQGFVVRMSAAASSGTLFQSAMSSLGSALASPVTAIAGLAYVVYDAHKAFTEGQRSVTEFGKSIVATNNAIKGDPLEAFKTSISDAQAKLDELNKKGNGKSFWQDVFGDFKSVKGFLGLQDVEESFNLDGAKKSAKELVNTLTGNYGAVQNFARALTGVGLGPTLDKNVLGMKEFAAQFPQASGSVDDLTRKLLELARNNNIDLTGPIEEWLPRLQEAYRSTQELTKGGVDPLTGAIKETGNAAEDASKKLDALKKGTDSWLQGITGFSDAEIGWFDQLSSTLETLTGNLKDGSLAWDLSTKEGRDNQRAINDLTRAAGTYIESLRAQGLSTEQLTQKKKDVIETLRIEGQKLGLNRQEVELLTSAIDKIPTDKTTTVTANTSQAMAALTEVLKLLDKISVTNPYAYADAGSLGILNTPTRSANGNAFPGGGWSWVGERGPELMYVPAGGAVVPLTDRYVRSLAGASAGGAGGTTVIVNQYVRGDVLTERRLADARTAAVRRGTAGLT